MGKTSSKLLQAHEKVCDVNERKKQRRKNDAHVKMLLMKRGSL